MPLEPVISASHVIAAFSAEGPWMGFDGVMALLAGVFPAWGLFTIVRGWVREMMPAPAPARVADGAARLNEGRQLLGY